MAKLGAKASWNNNYCESVTANKTLVAKDSGKVFILTCAARTVTLHTISSSIAGFHCTFISGDDSEHVIQGMASKGYGFRHQHVSSTGGDIDAEEVRSSLTLDAGVIGDRIEVMCDGTNWYFLAWSTGSITPAN